MNWRELGAAIDKIAIFTFSLLGLLIVVAISFYIAHSVESYLKPYSTPDQYEAIWRLSFGIASACGIAAGYMLFATFRTHYSIQTPDSVLIITVVVLLSMKFVGYKWHILELERIAPLHAKTITTGLWEEFMFRGLVLRFLLLFGQKVRISVLISSLCFAAIHYPLNSGAESEKVTQALFAFAIGIVFSLIVLKKHHIYLVMMLHALNNLLMGYTIGARNEVLPLVLSAAMAIAACVILYYARPSIHSIDEMPFSNWINKSKVSLLRKQDAL